MAIWLDVLKYGAIGVSLACLILTFANSKDLNKRAAQISENKLKHLTAHSRWTMAFAALCLVSAVVVEALEHRQRPVLLSVDVHPSDFLDRARTLAPLQGVPQPVLIRVAGSADEVRIQKGTGQLHIRHGSTLSINFESMFYAIAQLEAVNTGEHRRRLQQTGIVEPRK